MKLSDFNNGGGGVVGEMKPLNVKGKVGFPHEPLGRGNTTLSEVVTTVGNEQWLITGSSISDVLLYPDVKWNFTDMGITPAACSCQSAAIRSVSPYERYLYTTDGVTISKISMTDYTTTPDFANATSLALPTGYINPTSVYFSNSTLYVSCVDANSNSVVLSYVNDVFVSEVAKLPGSYNIMVINNIIYYAGSSGLVHVYGYDMTTNTSLGRLSSFMLIWGEFLGTVIDGRLYTGIGSMSISIYDASTLISDPASPPHLAAVEGIIPTATKFSIAEKYDTGVLIHLFTGSSYSVSFLKIGDMATPYSQFGVPVFMRIK